jgi:hypothetical protein
MRRRSLLFLKSSALGPDTFNTESFLYSKRNARSSAPDSGLVIPEPLFYVPPYINRREKR